jgi:hypothetical protein
MSNRSIINTELEGIPVSVVLNPETTHECNDHTGRHYQPPLQWRYLDLRFVVFGGNDAI